MTDAVVLTACIRIDVLQRTIQEFATPEQKKLTTVVGEMSEDSILQRNRVMEKLAREESTLTPCMGTKNRSDEDGPVDIAELRREIAGNPDDAIKKNAKLSNGKFDIPRREVMAEAARAINQGMETGSRVRVVDPVSGDTLRGSMQTAASSHEQVLQRLISLLFSQDELPSILKTIFSNKESTHTVHSPQRGDAQVVVDILDEVYQKTPINSAG